MGDEGKLYIPEDEVPQYKCLLGEADLILPNQFEAEYAHLSLPSRLTLNQFLLAF
jgi:pyridoxal/pyridoxine/pyridoxamine kinase